MFLTYIYNIYINNRHGDNIRVIHDIKIQLEFLHVPV